MLDRFLDRFAKVRGSRRREKWNDHRRFHQVAVACGDRPPPCWSGFEANRHGPSARTARRGPMLTWAVGDSGRILASRGCREEDKTLAVGRSG